MINFFEKLGFEDIYKQHVEDVHNHLPPKYSTKIPGKTMNGIVSAVSHMIYGITLLLKWMKQQIFVKTADGPVFFKKDCSIKKITGIQVVYVSGEIEENELDLRWNSKTRRLKLGDYPAIYLFSGKQEYNLTSNWFPKAFIVIADVDNMPDTSNMNVPKPGEIVQYPYTMIETLKLKKRFTVDYLDRLCRTKAVKREQVIDAETKELRPETDKELREKALNRYGLGNTKKNISLAMKHFLKSIPFELKERKEKWETPFIAGLSFIGYSGQKELQQSLNYISEHSFGSHFFEKSQNLYKFQLHVTDALPEKHDKYILSLLNEYKMLGITPEITRSSTPGPSND